MIDITLVYPLTNPQIIISAYLARPLRPPPPSPLPRLRPPPPSPRHRPPPQHQVRPTRQAIGSACKNSIAFGTHLCTNATTHSGDSYTATGFNINRTPPSVGTPLGTQPTRCVAPCCCAQAHGSPGRRRDPPRLAGRTESTLLPRSTIIL